MILPPVAVAWFESQSGAIYTHCKIQGFVSTKLDRIRDLLRLLKHFQLHLKNKQKFYIVCVLFCNFMSDF